MVNFELGNEIHPILEKGLLIYTRVKYNAIKS